MLVDWLVSWSLHPTFIKLCAEPKPTEINYVLRIYWQIDTHTQYRARWVYGRINTILFVSPEKNLVYFCFIYRRVHISEKTLQCLSGEFEVEPAFGEKREETLRIAGLKTYFIKKVLIPVSWTDNRIVWDWLFFPWNIFQSKV